MAKKSSVNLGIIAFLTLVGVALLFQRNSIANLTLQVEILKGQLGKMPANNSGSAVYEQNVRTVCSVIRGARISEKPLECIIGGDVPIEIPAGFNSRAIAPGAPGFAGDRDPGGKGKSGILELKETGIPGFEPNTKFPGLGVGREDAIDGKVRCIEAHGRAECDKVQNKVNCKASAKYLFRAFLTPDRRGIINVYVCR